MTSVGRVGSLRWNGMIVVVALIAAGCGTEQRSTVVATGELSTVTPRAITAAGITVTLPATPVAGTVTVNVGSAPAATFAGRTVKPLSSFVDVDSPPGAIDRDPATVLFPLADNALREGEVPVVMWEDDNGDLYPIASSPAPGGIRAALQHFSGGFLGKIDLKAWAAKLGGDVRNVLVSRSGVAHPDCGDSGAIDPAVRFVSDQGDTVKWCAGVIDGKTVFKVANNRRTVAMVTYPAAWKPVDGTPNVFDLSDSGIIATLSTVATGWTAPKGKAIRLVDGGRTLTFEVPPGALSGSVRVEMDMMSWALTGIKIGAELLLTVRRAARLPEPGGGPWERFLIGFGQPGTNGLKDALQDCALGQRDFTAATSDVDIMKTTLQWSFDCIPKLAKSDAAAMGLTNWFLGTVTAAVVAVIGPLLTAVHLILVGARELWDNLSAFGGRSDNFFAVTVSAPASTTTSSKPTTSTAAPTSSRLGGARPSLGSCEGVTIGFLPPGTKDWRPAKCADGWVIVSHPVAGGGEALTVARFKETPGAPKAVGTWLSYQRRTEVVAGMTTAGVPAAVAEVLYDAATKTPTPWPAKPDTCPTLSDLKARTDLDRPSLVGECAVGTKVVAFFGAGGAAEQPIALIRPIAGGPWEVVADGEFRVNVCALVQARDPSFGPDCGRNLRRVETGKPIG